MISILFISHGKRKQDSSKARACCNLGIIYNKENDFDKAVEYFEKFFQIAKDLDDKKMLESARVYLGISRGNKYLRQQMLLRESSSNNPI